MDILSYKLGKNSSGGGGGDIDWSAIGYTGTPQSIIDGYNQAKTIQTSYTNSKTYYGYSNGGYDLMFFPLVDTSARTQFSNIFHDCFKLIYVPVLDTSNAINMTGMFNSCRALTTIPQFDTSKVESFIQFCYGCETLKNIPVLNTSSATTLQSAFGSCRNLSDTSLNNIMRMCINATKISSNKTLIYIGLSSEQATRCQSLSNYQAFLNAGWTTGY